MRLINLMNIGFATSAAFSLAACLGNDDEKPAAVESDSDAGGKAGAGGASGNAGAAGSGDTGGADGGDVEKCIPGLVNDCHCADGADGVQSCKGDGTFEACKCEGGGSGGTSGTGGSAGSSGGSGGLPGCTAGEVKDCRCVDLSDGTQTCSSDGKSYGLCVCPNPGNGEPGTGTGGSGGAPSDGTVDVTFSFTPPTNAPVIKGAVLWGIPNDAGTWGQWASLCDSNSPTPSEVLLKSGSTYSCTRSFPTGITLDLNVEVNAEAGTSFPSNLGEQYACYGVGTNCDSESCFAAYGTVKVNGTKLTVPEDAVGNYGQHGCNFRIDVE